MLSASKLWKSSSISGPVGDLEAGAAEQRLDAQPRLRDRMQPAALLAAARQRDVDAPGGELALDVGAARAPRARASMRRLHAAPWPR